MKFTRTRKYVYRATCAQSVQIRANVCANDVEIEKLLFSVTWIHAAQLLRALRSDPAGSAEGPRSCTMAPTTATLMLLMATRFHARAKRNAPPAQHARGLGERSCISFKCNDRVIATLHLRHADDRSGQHACPVRSPRGYDDRSARLSALARALATAGSFPCDVRDAPASFLVVTFSHLLDEYRVRKYGRRRPPAWISRLSGGDAASDGAATPLAPAPVDTERAMQDVMDTLQLEGRERLALRLVCRAACRSELQQRPWVRTPRS
jgi:hypothetical protein